MELSEDIRRFIDILKAKVCRMVPFMEAVFEVLTLKCMPKEKTGNGSDFATDGVFLYVNPDLKKRGSEKYYTMALLHELMHVYLEHPYPAQFNQREEYDEKCDAEVEKYLRGCEKDGIKWMDRGGTHDLWYSDDEEERENENEGNGCKEGKGGKDGKEGKGDKGGKEGDFEGRESSGEKRDKTEIWKKLRYYKDCLLMAGGNGQFGSDQNLEEGYSENVSYHKEQVNYIDVLKEYFKIKEEAVDKDEGLDAILYTYGLEMYENITFVEAPEEIETSKINFCMAVDVSGSCIGETVERFISQTKQAIEEISDSNKTEIDVVLLLCDTRITAKYKISTASDFPKASDLVITGGGTNFIPVFNYVSELNKKNNTNMPLFYYSDGMGEFPNEQPEFDTYFLMEQKYEDCGEIPDWVKKIII